MVTSFRMALGAIGPLLAAEAADPVLERLDPPRRAAVVMALLGLVLTGLVLVACVMLGANWVRRLARHKPRSGPAGAATTPELDNRRLRASLENMLPKSNIGDTLHMDVTTKDTKADS